MKKYFDKLYAFMKENYQRIIMDFFVVLIIIVLCNYPLPYVVYRPGGIINLNDRITVEGGDDITGSYNMSYVTVARGNLPNLFLASVFSNWDILKEEDSLTYDEDYETNLKISQMDLENSVNTATLVAFKKAGYAVAVKNKQIVVKSIDDKARTNLEKLDQIEKIEGTDCKDILDLRAYIGSFEIGSKITLLVKNESGMVEKYAYVYEYENRKVIGITFFEKYDYQMPLATNFNARASESGSSGGLMLSLMMYDQLIPEDLTRGKTVVGTGTIDKDGNVGAIGGIKYKMLGARKKADVFLVPEANCEDAQNIYNTFEMNFTMACVKTFDEAIDFLNGI